MTVDTYTSSERGWGRREETTEVFLKLNRKFMFEKNREGVKLYHLIRVPHFKVRFTLLNKHESFTPTCSYLFRINMFSFKRLSLLFS